MRLRRNSTCGAKWKASSENPKFFFRRIRRLLPSQDVAPNVGGKTVQPFGQFLLLHVWSPLSPSLWSWPALVLLWPTSLPCWCLLPLNVFCNVFGWYYCPGKRDSAGMFTSVWPLGFGFLGLWCNFGFLCLRPSGRPVGDRD